MKTKNEILDEIVKLGSKKKEIEFQIAEIGIPSVTKALEKELKAIDKQADKLGKELMKAKY